ncbi:ABC transporter ATP-binding protein [Desnuesiella massiliensis]|uniref:ABC transporter ATP-binding protein n=1 Tax=Desnuesiella massiliensis TaxID=1650662 RepID=UPI0006E2EB62|nr:ABC transporter ATP-binding protein [Desnuesiella massiliensis]
MDNSILRLENITKIYGNGVLANNGVNLDIKKGEIHAIVGENGAGKSTLMKIIFGMEQPNEGSIYLKGQKIKIDNANKAIELGIGMVHQHFMLLPSFTVTQNIILGMEPKKGIKIDYAKAEKMVSEFAEKYNFRIKPNDKVKDLSIGMKQKVEIVKALIRGAEVLILDEPTAVLTPQETAELFEQLKLLKNEGHTIIFISHKLKEVKAICDRITIMRKGESKGVYNISDVTERQISNLMVGRDVVLKYDKKEASPGDVVLKVESIFASSQEGNKVLNDVSFSLRKGTILGIAGVEGNGQGELIDIITGRRQGYTGQVLLDNADIRQLSIAELRSKGLSYITEDRMSLGIAGAAKISENIISNRYKSKDINGKILTNKKKVDEITVNLIKEYEVACKNESQLIEHLSGGNIQKVVVARECSVAPKVLVAEQPTRGVDMGAAEAIHKKLINMRDNETGILLVSADISEAMEVSDYLMVMYGGEIVAFIDNPSSISEEELGEYMLGIKRQSPEEIRRSCCG